VGSLFLIGERVEPSVWATLETTLADILETCPGKVLGAVSRPAAPGLAVKLVARSAPDLTMILGDLWAAVRKCLWNLPAANLRRY
jgi:urease accessory protein